MTLIQNRLFYGLLGRWAGAVCASMCVLLYLFFSNSRYKVSSTSILEGLSQHAPAFEPLEIIVRIQVCVYLLQLEKKIHLDQQLQ